MLTRRNSATMTAIEKAIADLESHESAPNFRYTFYAKKWAVDRSTLSRRHRGVCASRKDHDAVQQAVHPQQELELVVYITELHKRGLPPTREMIQNFSTELAGRDVSMSWVDRFLHRNSDYLISRWAPKIDRIRH